MPTPTKGPRLGGGPAHERLILANLATALFEHDKITTTEAKAKRLRPLAERLITFAKRGDLHARRRVLTVVRDKGVVHRLFTEIAPDMAQRPGGYTRITKIGARKGDNAPMAVIELVREVYSPKQATVKEAEAATKRAAKKAAAPAEAPAEAAEAPAVSAEEAATGGGCHAGRWRLRARLGARAGRRFGARGLPGQGQQGLDEVPHPRVAVLRADRRGGLLQGRRGGREGGLRRRLRRRGCRVRRILIGSLFHDATGPAPHGGGRTRCRVRPCGDCRPLCTTAALFARLPPPFIKGGSAGSGAAVQVMGRQCGGPGRG